MRLHNLYVLVIAIVFSLPSMLHAQGDASPSIAYLNRISSDIVVGTGSITDAPNNIPTLNINVVRVLKGSGVRPHSQISIVLPSLHPPCGIPQDSTSITGLWFLNVDSGGTARFAPSPKSQACTPMDNDYEVPTAEPAGIWYYLPNTRPEDKVAYELAASLQAHDGRGPIASLGSSAFLEGTTPGARRDISEKLAESNIRSVQMLGLLGLLRLGDQATLQRIADNPGLISSVSLEGSAVRRGLVLPRAYNVPVGSPATFEAEFLLILRSTVSPNTKSTSILNDILVSPSSTKPTKLAVARALRNTHSAKAAVDLAPLLYDGDPAMRAEAVGTIASYVNGVPALDPSRPNVLDLNQPGPYKTNDTVEHFAMGTAIAKREDYYLNYWRFWWSLNGAKVVASASANN